MLNQPNIDALNAGTLNVASRDSDAETRASVMAEISSLSLHKTMARAVVRACGETGATEDIVQSALINMIEHAESFDWSKGSLVSWGCRIAVNVARNWRKASANRGHYSEGPSDEDGDSEALVDTLVAVDGRNVIEARSEMSKLAAAISTLDADSQTFLDAMSGGMGQTEAGALVGWSPATSTRRYRSIAATLADHL